MIAGPVVSTTGNALNVSVTPLPQGARVENGRLRWTPSFTQAGSYPLQVTATDGSGLSDSASFTVTVTNTPQPPQILELTGDSEGDEGQTLAFEAEVAHGFAHLEFAEQLDQTASECQADGQ